MGFYSSWKRAHITGGPFFSLAVYFHSVSGEYVIVHVRFDGDITSHQDTHETSDVSYERLRRETCCDTHERTVAYIRIHGKI